MMLQKIISTYCPYWFTLYFLKDNWRFIIVESAIVSSTIANCLTPLNKK
jgi:hypothetical protein